MIKSISSKLALVLLSMSVLVSAISCTETTQGGTQLEDDVVLGLKMDQIHMNKAYVRIVHNGAQEDFWYYLVTEDFTSDATELLQNELAQALEANGEIVANAGVNKSVLIDNLEPKTDYRVIASRIDHAGDLLGNLAETSFRTLRDPDVFEEYPDWLITYKERTTSKTNPNLEIEVFSCSVSGGDDQAETYVPVVISKADFEGDCRGSIRTCFESYIYYLTNTERVNWADFVTDSDSEFTQDRLVSGDYILFMVGVDTLGTLTGYYSKTEYRLEQEKMTDKYASLLGKWAIVGTALSKGDIRYDVEIVAEENNLYYRMKGWEATTAAQYFVNTMNIPNQLPIPLYFEKSTGDVYIISEALKEVSDFNLAEMYDFYFYGCVDMDGMIIPVDIPNIKIARLEFEDATHATLVPEIFEFDMDGYHYKLPFALFEYSYVSLMYDGLVPMTADSEVPLLSTIEMIKL